MARSNAWRDVRVRKCGDGRKGNSSPAGVLKHSWARGCDVKPHATWQVSPYVELSDEAARNITHGFFLDSAWLMAAISRTSAREKRSIVFCVMLNITVPPNARSGYRTLPANLSCAKCCTSHTLWPISCPVMVMPESGQPTSGGCEPYVLVERRPASRHELVVTCAQPVGDSERGVFPSVGSTPLMTRTVALGVHSQMGRISCSPHSGCLDSNKSGMRRFKWADGSRILDRNQV